MSGTLVSLLAKSGFPRIYLDEHTTDVENALDQIRQIWPDLPVSLYKAARFHDFGKAADGFQNMLLNNVSWSYRHEVLSAAIFRECFALHEPDMWRAYLALLSHHKNFLDTDQRVSADFRHCQSHTSSGANHWRKKWNELNVPALRTLFAEDLVNWQFNADISSPADKAGEHADAVLPVFDDVQTAFCRGALVAADHLASAKMGRALLGENITLSALEDYANTHIENWSGWSAMQKACCVKNSALLIAPTGSGKTEAALLWMLHNRNRFERIFYVLPYQVSINAMADRLSNVFPDDVGNTLLHKNTTVSALHSNTALAYLQSAMNDETSNMTQEQAIATAEHAREAAHKIYSPIKITTVYQLLAIFFGRKFFEVSLLELKNALIIFDEIHAYDGHTLGLILVLLKSLHRLGAQVFIMTATLPPSMNNLLCEAADITPKNQLSLSKLVETVPPGAAQQHNEAQTAALSLLREVRRTVHLYPYMEITMLVPQIRNAVQSGKRVAVVCNTVDKALLLCARLCDLSPMLIHSRFTIGHRAKRETKENLQRSPFVISTQVIEVSLDVSFDVMFTELAPIDDLLQRFGRVNRHELREPTTHGVCHIALAKDSGSNTIYSEQLLERTRQTLLADAERDEQDGMRTKPLDYYRACEWILSVYPEGLPPDQNEAMQRSKEDFQALVNSLRPMVDAPRVDLEQNLFQSVQIVPARYALEWCDLKKQKRHLEAKQFIVNVDARVWRGYCKEYGSQAQDTVSYGSGKYQKKQIIALFPYDADTGDTFNGTGLRLDQGSIPNPLIQRCIFSDEDED